MSSQSTLHPLPRTTAEITWSHATNTQSELREALDDDDIAMIEADVMVGRIIVAKGQAVGSDDAKKEVIMSHPPILTRFQCRCLLRFVCGVMKMMTMMIDPSSS